MLPDFKLYYRPGFLSHMVLAHTHAQRKVPHRWMGQNKEPRSEPTLLWSSVYDNGGENIQCRKKASSIINGVGKTGLLNAQESN